MINARCRVTATGFSLSGVSRSAISLRNSGASSSGPRALRFIVSSSYAPSKLSGLPMAPSLRSASPYTQYSILDTLASSGPHALRPSCPRIRPLSPCHHAHVSPRGFAALTFAPLHAAPAHLHLCIIYGDPLRNFQPAENCGCPSILFSTAACCSGVSPSGNFFEERRQRSSHSWPMSG
jgi:hypothetical protein